MAIRFNAVEDTIVRIVDVLDVNSPYTWMGWIRRAGAGSALQAIFAAGAVGPSYDSLYSGDAGGAQQFTLWVNDVAAENNTNVTLNTWFHVAMVRRSTTALDLYINGVFAFTNTTSIAGRAPTVRMSAGGNSDSLEWFNGRVAAEKIWTTTLSADEILQEMQRVAPKRLHDVYGWWAHFPGANERLVDYSGNNREWTTIGSLTDEDGPPIGWGYGRSGYVSGLPAGQTIALGQVAEADTAQVVSWAPKHRLLNGAIETDTAQGFTSLKTGAIGQVLEFDLAQGVGRGKSITLGQPVETDVAQIVTRGPISILIGQVVEVDTVFPMSWNPKIRVLGKATEMDLAMALVVIGAGGGVGGAKRMLLGVGR